MKIAIDLDGTAFAWPDEFQRLIIHLEAGGAEVVFLTAAAGEFAPDARPAEVTRRISSRLPRAAHIKVFCCESRDKGPWLRRNGFDAVIDDNEIDEWTGLRLEPNGQR